MHDHCLNPGLKKKTKTNKQTQNQTRKLCRTLLGQLEKFEFGLCTERTTLSVLQFLRSDAQWRTKQWWG